MVWKLSESLFSIFLFTFMQICARDPLYNGGIIQLQRFGSIAQPCYLNINKPKTKDVQSVRYGST